MLLVLKRTERGGEDRERREKKRPKMCEKKVKMANNKQRTAKVPHTRDALTKSPSNERRGDRGTRNPQDVIIACLVLLSPSPPQQPHGTGNVLMIRE